jgi:hypothetical protein
MTDSADRMESGQATKPKPMTFAAGVGAPPRLQPACGATVFVVHEQF